MKQFEVVFNGINFNLRNNLNHEELRLTDEKACYDYIADLLNLKNETITRLDKEKQKLEKEKKELKDMNYELYQRLKALRGD